MFCDILLPDGSPSYADPRWVLKRALGRASDPGFTFCTHPEIEFSLLKEVAIEQGVYATFMPKPFTDYPGSGMHSHVALFEGDRNAFYEPGAELQLSKIGRAFIAGLLRRAAEIAAVCNPYLAYALILAAGLKGIEDHYDLPPPADDVSHIARSGNGSLNVGGPWSSQYWER